MAVPAQAGCLCFHASLSICISMSAQHSGRFGVELMGNDA